MTKKTILMLFLLACAVVILAVGLTHLPEIFAFLGRGLDIISPIIIGLCMAFVFNVIMSALESRVLFKMSDSKSKFVRGMKRPLALILTFLVAFGMIVLLVSVITPSIKQFVDIVVKELPGFIDTSTKMIVDFLAKNDIEIKFVQEGQIKWKEVMDTLVSWLNLSTDNVVNITAGIFSSIFDFVLSFILSIYVLVSKERIGNFMHRLMKSVFRSRTVKWIEKVSKLTYRSFARFISGQFIEAIILGVLCFIGMCIFRIPLASVVSVLVGVTALLPIFGAWIGGGVGALLIVMEDPIKALIFIIFILVLQQLEGNIIYPKVVGESIGLPGILVLSAVIIGGGLGGIPGVLFGVPVTSVIYTLIRQFMDKKTTVNGIPSNAVALPDGSFALPLTDSAQGAQKNTGDTEKCPPKPEVPSSKNESKNKNISAKKRKRGKK